MKRDSSEGVDAGGAKKWPDKKYHRTVFAQNELFGQISMWCITNSDLLVPDPSLPNISVQ